MRLLTDEPSWSSEPLGKDRLRLEVHHSPCADVDARDLREHFLTLQASGSARIEIDDGPAMRSCLIAAGGFCLSPAGPVAPVRWHAPRTLFVVALTPRWLGTLADEDQRGPVALRCAIGARDPDIEWLVRALVDESKKGHPTGPMYVDSLAHALALRILFLHRADGVAAYQRGGLAGTRLRAVLERMREDFTRPASTTELARLAGLSVDHFVRAFRSSIGEPPHRYLLRERIREAQRLLSTTSQPLVEIALQTGFGDQSHFHTTFRRWVGTTPSRYRAEN
jgi:AraC family transcriptional regulator